MKKIIFIIALFAIGLAGCASKNSCPKTPAVGNLNSGFNSDNDEYSPYFYENSFYYTVSNKEKKLSEKVYKSDFIDGRFSRPQIDTSLSFLKLLNSAMPVFAINPKTENLESIFAAVTKNGSLNRNLFHSEKVNNKWSEPKPIKEINTHDFESHPSLSPDGKVFVFSSDREGGKGAIDLYVSLRNPDGTWSAPRNLTEINTEVNEITPYIAEDGSLYFASQGHNGGSDYDIIKASPNGIGKWHSPKLLPMPINSEADETGPAIFKDKIFVSSNRAGGCGGKDIYAFSLCGPVSLECLIVSTFPNFPLAGTVNLYDEKGEIVSTKKVDGGGVFSFDLIPNNNYKVEYINDCTNEFTEIKDFYAPCSDSSVVVIKTMFEFSPQDEFDLVEVKVPFFVSGYYMPNTRENLEALRLKFAYNLIGIDESTRYIEKPGEEYDSFSKEVEDALDKASASLYDVVAGLSDECLERKESKIQITITGFADPRSINPKAVFPDADINDERFGLQVPRGVTMDNLLLSKLRAYYSAKYFENYIKMKDKTGSIEGKLIWKIEGKGVDANAATPDKMKRRVNIKIKPI